MSPIPNTPSMADVAVVHPDLEVHGGAENVCMHIIEALQSEHDLTLFTLNLPDLPALNRYFRTNVSPVRICLAGRLGPALNRRVGHRLAKFQAVLLGRQVDECINGYDLVFSTKNEFAFDTPSIQYVHSPQFVAADPGIDRTHIIQRTYDRLCHRLAGVREESLRSATHLANSNWTADVLNDAYDVHAETVYPPVDTSIFPDRPWADRETGFVSIGRVGPSKRVIHNIDVVGALRERGHDIHLHIAGPTTDDKYAERVKREAARRAFVFLEGALDRDELVDLIANHKYGLHGRPYEHFGIAVAELVAGGAIPFAPNSGGQQEILSEDTRLLYDSTEGAIEKIDAVLSNRISQRDLRAEHQNIASAFGRDRFIAEIQTIVRQELP